MAASLGVCREVPVNRDYARQPANRAPLPRPRASNRAPDSPAQSPTEQRVRLQRTDASPVGAHATGLVDNLLEDEVILRGVFPGPD